MDEIHLVPYNPDWPAMYAAEEVRLRKALPPGLVLAMEHFGSTAIPGLIAKPIIDILVIVSSVRDARKTAVTPMEKLGYAFWAENPKQDRLFFVKGLPPAAPHRTHHVHMSEAGGAQWQRLVFRDYLRRHSEEAGRYSALKSELAARHENDREAYTNAKTAYVDEITAKAHAAGLTLQLPQPTSRLQNP